MRSSYPAADGAPYPDGASLEASDGATDPTTWPAVGQLGGQSLAATQRVGQRGFALCAQDDWAGGGLLSAGGGPAPP